MFDFTYINIIRLRNLLTKYYDNSFSVNSKDDTISISVMSASSRYQFYIRHHKMLWYDKEFLPLLTLLNEKLYTDESLEASAITCRNQVLNDIVKPLALKESFNKLIEE